MVVGIIASWYPVLETMLMTIRIGCQRVPSLLALLNLEYALIYNTTPFNIPENERNWRQYVYSGVEARIRIQKMYADVTYGLLGLSAPARMENIVEGDYIPLSAADYLHVLDQIYPTFPSRFDSSARCNLVTMAQTMLKVSVPPNLWEPFLLPLLLEQNSHSPQSPSDDPALAVDAVVVRKGYRVLVDWVAMWVYVGLLGFILLSCYALLCLSGSTRIPRTSDFPDFDLVHKFVVKRGETENLSALRGVISALVQGKEAELQIGRAHV